MRFYTNQHPFDCGIDLHARSMYVCIVSHDGEMLLHRNMKAAPEPFLQAVAPYRDGLVVAVECLFTWYWLAALCAAEGIPFVLGHALYFDCLSRKLSTVVYVCSMEPIGYAVSNDRSGQAHCAASASGVQPTSATSCRTETPRARSPRCPGESVVALWQGAIFSPLRLPHQKPRGQ